MTFTIPSLNSSTHSVASHGYAEAIINVGYAVKGGKLHLLGPIPRSIAMAASLTIRTEALKAPFAMVVNVPLNIETDKDATRAVLAWMMAHGQCSSTPPISVDEVEKKMGRIGVTKVLKIYRVLDVLNIRSAQADDVIRDWLLRQFTEIGITIEQVEEVWNAFPLVSYPANALHKRNLCPRLFKAIHEWEYDSETSYSVRSEIHALRKRNPRLDAAWHSSWRSYLAYRKAKDGFIKRNFSGGSNNSTSRLEDARGLASESESRKSYYR